MFFKNKKINKGFTIMELLVVMFVSTLILASLVVQNNRWNDHLTVSTQAYEFTLMIRQAQVYSLGVREDVGGSGDKFNVAYGVYFDEDSFDRYTFFADRNRNNRYDEPSEAIETKYFTRGVSISRICGTGSGQVCSTGGSIDNITVLFFRPSTAANVYFRNNGGGDLSALMNAPARIYLRSLGNKQSLVTIDDNGQVSVDDL